jgi:hypothetical protein
MMHQIKLTAMLKKYDEGKRMMEEIREERWRN